MASKNKKNNLRIAEIMQEKGMSLADMAALCTRVDDDGNKKTLTPATLSARINGNPSLSNLYEIANVLGVKITELFPEEDQCVVPTNNNQGFNIQTVCPSCGARISASVSAG